MTQLNIFTLNLNIMLMMTTQIDLIITSEIVTRLILKHLGILIREWALLNRCQVITLIIFMLVCVYLQFIYYGLLNCWCLINNFSKEASKASNQVLCTLSYLICCLFIVIIARKWLSTWVMNWILIRIAIWVWILLMIILVKYIYLMLHIQ